MEHLQNGQFYGQTNETIHLNGLTITDTEYTHPKVDWHYHEHAYFTFVLDGRVVEGNKKEIYHCTPGSLLYHNWQDAHYNIKPAGYTRGFHIELHNSWFKEYDIHANALQGSINVADLHLKTLMYNIFKETKLNDPASELAIHTLLITLLDRIQKNRQAADKSMPPWVLKIKELLHHLPAESRTIRSLAELLGIHPVHLSRDFIKYFHCTPGTYIRAIQVQRALALMPDKKLSLTDIALAAGFADQSHFIRIFRAHHATTPAYYRRLLLK